MKHGFKAAVTGALLAASLVLVVCALIQPYEVPNHREDGPQKGLFTGARGEWVILGPKDSDVGVEEKSNGEVDPGTEDEGKQ